MAGSDQNLQDILRTLSSFTTPQPGISTHFHPPYSQPQQSHWGDLEEGEYDPASLEPNATNNTLNNHTPTHPVLPVALNQDEALRQSIPHSRPPPQAPPGPTISPAFQVPTNPSPASAPTGPDPTLILTWPAAMSHLRPLLGSDAFTAKINRMIRNQRNHERQWHAGREALRAQQAERGAKRSEIADVLKAVGGKVFEGGTAEREPEEQAREMDRFDGKVYRAMGEMQRGMGVELAGLGVPFFCTREGSVVGEGDGREEERRRLVREGRGVDDGRERITKTDLVKLQKRMLKFLEESCME